MSPERVSVGEEGEGHVLLLLSLDAHNHVDDYSDTLGGVRETNKNSLHFSSGHVLKFLNCCTVSNSLQKTKQNKKGSDNAP